MIKTFVIPDSSIIFDHRKNKDLDKGERRNELIILEGKYADGKFRELR